MQYLTCVIINMNVGGEGLIKAFYTETGGKELE